MGARSVVGDRPDDCGVLGHPPTRCQQRTKCAHPGAAADHGIDDVTEHYRVTVQGRWSRPAHRRGWRAEGW
jgi:hypothetical protein